MGGLALPGLRAQNSAGISSRPAGRSVPSRIASLRSDLDPPAHCHPDFRPRLQHDGAGRGCASGGRLVNIHPSLLPAFRGLHTHRQALAAGVRIHGCTVHFVTPDLDHGPIIIQAAVPVMPDDDEARLAARVLAEEHRIYPLALRWLCEDRVQLLPDGRVVIAQAAPAAGALHSPALQ